MPESTECPAALLSFRYPSIRLGTEVEYVAWNCMGRAVRQFEKEVSFRPEKGEVLSNCHFKKNL